MGEHDYVLIADDMEVNRAILSEIFCSSYSILEAADGKEALWQVRRHEEELSVVLLDIVMPEMSGYDVLVAMRDDGILVKVPVVVVTSEDSIQSEMKSFDLGASDLIMKPFEPHVVRRRVQNIIDLYQHKNNLEHLVETQAQRLQASNEAMIDALSSVIEYRNLESGQHIRRIRLFTRILAERISRAGYSKWGPADINMISSAASMHDIGKIAIPDSILTKPGRLTDEEFGVMKTHAEKGSEMILEISWMSDQEYIRYAYDICRHHHERWDGRGYPDGLKGEDIPLSALVAGVADVYDALTTVRVYKGAYTHKEAVRMICGGECGSFPQWLLDCLLNVEKNFARLAHEYADGRALPGKVRATTIG